MTPKEKAEQLINQFLEYADSNYAANKFEKNWQGIVLAEERKVLKKSAKQCALIAVDELLDSYTKEKSYGYIISDKIIPYWNEVKQEIESYETIS
jgi:hypothetical protein